MMKYFLLKILTGRKTGKFLYKIVDESGNVLHERKSNRDYVAATINGQFFFGRFDLIGKGDHARQVKPQPENNIPLVPVAYLKEGRNEN